MEGTVPGGRTVVLIGQIYIIIIFKCYGVQIGFDSVQLVIDLLLVERHGGLCVVVDMFRQQRYGGLILESDQGKKKQQYEAQQKQGI